MTVTRPRGFRASGVAAGLKSSGAPDVALVVNDGPSTTAAGVYTANRFDAAPVRWSRPITQAGSARAIVLNSGGANACTGAAGDADSAATAAHVARLLDVPADQVLVCSTGLIGERLPMDRLLAGADNAHERLATDGGDAAAVAIMTTDSHPKTAHAEGRAGGEGEGGAFLVGGIAKGAGMLAPGLATMLVVLTTDAVVNPQAADEALRAVTATTFDRVDSDGCMSTNDTVLLLASGASGVSATAEQLGAPLHTVAAELARRLVGDAEGASHDVAVHVHGATSEDAAVAVARAITRSNLVKTAIFGNDPNWGRILSAAGTVPQAVAPYDPNRVDVDINGVRVCRGGGVGEDRDLVDLASRREVHIAVHLHAGDHTATVWTNDLTHDYVHENSAYST